MQVFNSDQQSNPSAPAVPNNAQGTTGDIEKGNLVVSLLGMRIVTRTAAPAAADNTTGNWHPGDIWSTPASGAVGHIYQYGTDNTWRLLV